MFPTRCMWWITWSKEVTYICWQIVVVVVVVVVVVTLFPCYAILGGVASVCDVFVPTHKTDIVREILPGLSNMLRQNRWLKVKVNGAHAQVILFSLFIHSQWVVLTFCREILQDISRNLAGFAFWGSPKALHLQPGHLKMAFFSARCHLYGDFPAEMTAAFFVELP